jgi:hypothetical protein
MVHAQVACLRSYEYTIHKTNVSRNVIHQKGNNTQEHNISDVLL